MMSNFQSILDATDKYAEQTGINLNQNPFAEKVKSCDSPVAVLLLLQENMKGFKDYRDQNRKFVDCLSPIVHFVHAFSGVLGEVAGVVSRECHCRPQCPFFVEKHYLLLGSVPAYQFNLRRNQCSLHCACLPSSLAESI